MKAILPLLACLLGATACTHDTRAYPSLAPRTVEKLGFAEPEVKPAIVAPDPALDKDVAALAVKRDGIASGFAAAAARTEALAKAARGAGVGSEPWLTAQTALAGLDDWRAQASALVGEIDDRAADRAARLLPDYPALAALHDASQAEVDRETATIARIQATLPAA